MTALNHSNNPVIVEVTRGEMVESFHRGAVAVVDRQGEIVYSTGDINRLIYPRSAVKPLQAVVFAESGAMEHFSLTAKELALACASHSGQDLHVNGVRSWLHRIGVDEKVLECGAHASYHRATRNNMIRNNELATSLNNNCSGKHAGMISVAVYSKVAVKNYIDRAHPVQQRVLRTLSELTEEDVAAHPYGSDGCGIPVAGISLRGIAFAFAKLASKNFISKVRQKAAVRICEAMSKHPEVVGGENRFCTVVPRSTKAQVLVKVGAEGVYTGMLVNSNGFGFALKIDDGSRRAAEVTMGWLLSKFGNLSESDLASLNPYFEPKIKTVSGRPAGFIRSCLRL